jgi:hypothetical protein
MPWCPLHNTLFSLQLTNGPNKLECLFLASLSDLVQYNTLAHWAQVQELTMVTHLNLSAVDDVEVVTLVTLFNNFRKN